VKKPVCKLVTDEKGDAVYPVAPAPAKDDSLDIVSADIASNAVALTAVLEFAGNPPTNPRIGGYFASMRFQPPGQSVLYLGARYDVVGNAAGAPNYEWGIYNPSTGSSTAQANTSDVVAGSYDTTTHQMRISVRLSSLAGMKVAPGQRFTSLGAQTKAWYAPYVGQYAALVTDNAAAVPVTTAYIAGWPSCVKPAFP
jgi:hypothetical protein